MSVVDPGAPAIAQRKLSRSDFSRIRYFSPDEVERCCQSGAWQNIDAGSFYLLDRFAGYAVGEQRLVKAVSFMPTRTREGVPTATWNSPDTRAHSVGSMHYEGRAFDVMFPRDTLATAWLTAMRFPKWGGIGVYPFWRPDPGLHLDTRLPSAAEQGRGFRVLWWVDRDGGYSYLNSESDVLEFFDVLRSAA